MKSAAIRKAFLEFFHERGHKHVASSSLVPGNDPTLLFTNAGMVQFKETFLGLEDRAYHRAVSSQRCVRAGGKHNDLENVGYTARHHTFFEMLGNFSFGDYFKEEAIRYAWEFLTEELQLPKEKLWVTVYDEDSEAADIWIKKMGISEERLSRIGDKPGGKKYESDNFWSMGDTGPCGPCSEIFYDHGPSVAGGPPGTPEEDGDRYIEIWNLVFMQYDRDAEGTMRPLPKPSIDTGMGLERLAAIMQGEHNNYDIDLFRNLIHAAAKLTGTKDHNNKSLRVIADHIRACSFLVVDGVVPSNEGRGYVLRRIIRRAIRHGNKLGTKDPFFHKLVGPLCEEMGEAYPELNKLREHIERILSREEARFAETLEQGLQILESEISKLNGDTITGDVLFRLYDTYGFPVDLTADIAREHQLGVDEAGFEVAMAAQRERARAASSFEGDFGKKIELKGHTEFLGYDSLSAEAKVLSIYKSGRSVDTLDEGEQGMVVLDRTPFYAESGGQAGDAGLLARNGGHFEVIDTQKQGAAVFGHLGKQLSGSLKIGDRVDANVNAATRRRVECNHTSTHLLHAALRKVLGEHVTQKGSLVEAERLRFDFSHFESINTEQLAAIEALVNSQIRANSPIETKVMTPDDAVAEGAMALFGEKYGDSVRVLRINDFSMELCGGTHVERAGDIGFFKITSEGGVAAGVRRIEAVAAEAALQWANESDAKLAEVAMRVKAAGRDDVVTKVEQLLERTRGLEKSLAAVKAKLASAAGSDLASQAVDVGGVKVLAAKLEGADAKGLREIVDQLKNKLGCAAVVVACVNGEKISLAAGVTKNATDRIKAGELVNQVAQQVGGKGGGRPDMAMAGGNQPENLEQALLSVQNWAKQQINS